MSELLVDGRVVLNPIGAILFDKDGTLIDIHHYWVSMIRLRAGRIIKSWFSGECKRAAIEAELCEAMGINLDTGRMKPEGPVGVKPRQFIVKIATETVRAHGIEINDEPMEALFGEIDRETEGELLPLLRLLPGVEKLLEQAESAGVEMAVVSTDITERTRRAMEALGIAKHFRFIVGGDAVAKTKPAPDLAQRVLQEGGYRAEHTVVIGDHPVDIKMGIAAGTAVNIGVFTGLSTREGFAGLPCMLVDDLRSLQIRR